MMMTMMTTRGMDAVCLHCKAVTDGQIKEAMSRGLCTRKALVHCRGVGRDCGKCNRRGSRVIALVHPKPICHEAALLGMRPMAVS